MFLVICSSFRLRCFFCYVCSLRDSKQLKEGKHNDDDDDERERKQKRGNKLLSMQKTC